MVDWTTLLLTLKLAFVTTLILFVVSIPLAFWLSKTKSIFKTILLTLITLPLVLPPTVLGFYMLVFFSPESSLGSFLLNTFGLEFIFTFEGLVLASVIYSLPFMVQPIYAGLTNLPSYYKEAGATLGKTNYEILRHILLPNIKPSLWMGIVLSFAHTIGEFGVVLMIGGSVRGQTKVASISIFEAVEKMDYGLAHKYSLILIVFAFVVILMVHLLNKSKASHE